MRRAAWATLLAVSFAVLVWWRSAPTEPPVHRLILAQCQGASARVGPLMEAVWNDSRVVDAMVRRDIIPRRLDAKAHAEEWDAWIGRPGALFTVLVDPAAASSAKAVGVPPVLCVIDGFLSPEALVARIDQAAAERARWRSALEAWAGGDAGVEARWAVAEAWRRLGALRLAADLLDGLVGDDGLSPEWRRAAARSRARLWVLRGRAANARDVLSSVGGAADASANGGGADVRVTLAMACVVERRYAQALEAIEGALGSLDEPDERASAWWTQAAALHALEQDEAALAALARAESLGPTFAVESRERREHVLAPEDDHRHAP